MDKGLRKKSSSLEDNLLVVVPTWTSANRSFKVLPVLFLPMVDDEHVVLFVHDLGSVIALWVRWHTCVVWECLEFVCVLSYSGNHKSIIPNHSVFAGSLSGFHTVTLSNLCVCVCPTLPTPTVPNNNDVSRSILTCLFFFSLIM